MLTCHTYQNKSDLDYRLKKKSFAGHENSVTKAPATGLLADLVMMTMTVKNQHLTDERVDYSTALALELNNAWTFPTCTHSMWQVVIAWALTSFCKYSCLYSDLLTYQNWYHELMVNSQGSSHNITTHPILRLRPIDLIHRLRFQVAFTTKAYGPTCISCQVVEFLRPIYELSPLRWTQKRLSSNGALAR